MSASGIRTQLLRAGRWRRSDVRPRLDLSEGEHRAMADILIEDSFPLCLIPSSSHFLSVESRGVLLLLTSGRGEAPEVLSDLRIEVNMDMVIRISLWVVRRGSNSLRTCDPSRRPSSSLAARTRSSILLVTRDGDSGVEDLFSFHSAADLSQMGLALSPGT